MHRFTSTPAETPAGRKATAPPLPDRYRPGAKRFSEVEPQFDPPGKAISDRASPGQVQRRAWKNMSAGGEVRDLFYNETRPSGASSA